jgi:hypothetical protein
MVDKNFSGSSNCFKTPRADLLPFAISVSRRALLDDTSAISYMAKMPFSTSKKTIIRNSINGLK